MFFEGGWVDEMGVAPRLHKDKKELVHVGGQMLHKRTTPSHAHRSFISGMDC